jgi:AcrR family transcriptional regulator
MPETGLSTSRAESFARRRARISLSIERAALELFADHGADEVTVDQIAAAGGISERTFFRYFPSRDDILAALPRRENEEMARRVAARPASESILEAFIAAAHEPLSKEREETLRLWARAIRRQSVEVKRQHNADAGMVVVFGAVIAQRLGIEPTDRRARVMATAIASVTWFAFMEWLESGGSRPMSSVLEEAFDILAELNPDTGRPTRNGRKLR